MPDPAAFVEKFARFWAAPSLDGFAAVLRPDVTLVQPLSPPMRGLDAVRAAFAPVFRWLPDLCGTVDRWTATPDGVVVFIEFRLRATIGGRPFEWQLVDRFDVGADGLATARVSYFDPLPLLAATAGRPSTWWAFVRSGAAASLLR